MDDSGGPVEPLTLPGGGHNNPLGGTHLNITGTVCDHGQQGSTGFAGILCDQASQVSILASGVEGRDGRRTRGLPLTWNGRDIVDTGK
jgi:hypothetical protein